MKDVLITGNTLPNGLQYHFHPLNAIGFTDEKKRYDNTMLVFVGDEAQFVKCEDLEVIDYDES